MNKIIAAQIEYREYINEHKNVVDFDGKFEGAKEMEDAEFIETFEIYYKRQLYNFTDFYDEFYATQDERQQNIVLDENDDNENDDFEQLFS